MAIPASLSFARGTDAKALAIIALAVETRSDLDGSTSMLSQASACVWHTDDSEVGGPKSCPGGAGGGLTVVAATATPTAIATSTATSTATATTAATATVCLGAVWCAVLCCGVVWCGVVWRGVL